MSDPAVWIVVGLIACIHITYVIWRKSTEPFRWANFMTGFGIFALTGCCCFWGLVSNRVPIAVFLTPVACGLILSGRQPIVGLRIACSALGWFFGLCLTLLSSGIQQLDQYSSGEPTWLEGADEIRLNGNIPWTEENKDKHFPRGYVDLGTLGDSNPRNRGPFHFITPVPLWHSALTGVYARKTRAFRIWIPGGNLTTCLDEALAVPIGTPPGHEKSDGIPVREIVDDY